MISKTSYGKVSMHPNEPKKTSSSASMIDPLEQPIEDKPQDHIDEMKWPMGPWNIFLFPTGKLVDVWTKFQF